MKDCSDYLHSIIKNDLTDNFIGGFTTDDFQSTRFHGMYEQNGRSIRVKYIDQKFKPLKNMMLRCRLPGGVIILVQRLGIDEFVSDRTTYGSIRLTNRRTFQYHGISKTDLKLTHQFLHKLGLDSVATTSNINCNALCASNPVQSSLHQETYEWMKRISMYLLLHIMTYTDTWLDGEKVSTIEPAESRDKETADGVEPASSRTYLSCKFKAAVVIPPDNNVDVYSNDLGLVATEEDDRLAGFNTLVGDGPLSGHGSTKTYPNTSYEFGFVLLKYTLDTAETAASIRHDWSDRNSRKATRARYTLQRTDVEVFKKEVEKRMGVEFQSIRPYAFTYRGDHTGWTKGLGDNWHLTLFIENGRLLDYPDRLLRTGVREIARIHLGDFYLTADQNLVVANVPPGLKDTINKTVKEHGLVSKSITTRRENLMTCVALLTCPLTMVEAERFLPSFSDRIDEMFAECDLEDEHITLCVTGCPSGCGRTMLAEIGLVGKAIDRYNLYAGGNREGIRILRLFRESITELEILEIVDGWVGNWAQNRLDNEGFDDFAARTGIVKPVLDVLHDFWA